jgi:hypothetical protein
LLRKVAALAAAVLLLETEMAAQETHHQQPQVRAMQAALGQPLRAEMAVLAAAAVLVLLAVTVAGLQPGLAVQVLRHPLRGQALPEQVAAAVLVQLVVQVVQAVVGKAAMQVLGLAATELRIPGEVEAVLSLLLALQQQEALAVLE